ncbi:hypothetical protein NFI96_014533 [Prochilodus magdalenae]|nr:hypothetical protein NFI96_014533 [Prochilodus magdalenae]
MGDNRTVDLRVTCCIVWLEDPIRHKCRHEPLFGKRLKSRSVLLNPGPAVTLVLETILPRVAFLAQLTVELKVMGVMLISYGRLWFGMPCSGQGSVHSSWDGCPLFVYYYNNGGALSPTGHALVAACLGLIGALGILNNLLVLVLFGRYKALRSPINLLLLNISVSDLLVCALATPFSFAASARGRWLIGEEGCVWYGFANSLLGPPQDHHRAGTMWVVDNSQHRSDTDVVVVVLVWVVLVGHRTLPTGRCPQDAAHRTLPTGRCPQDAAHRTLPTGRCPQDAAHRTLPTGHYRLDSFGWWMILSAAVVLRCPPPRIVSLISLAVLSYERYSTMMGPTEADATNYRKVAMGVLLSWVYSLLWTLPPFFGWSRYGPEGPGTTCSVDWTAKTANNISYIICLFIFCLIFPFLVIVYSYGKLLHAIKQMALHKDGAVSDGIHRLGGGATVQGMSRSMCGKRSRADVNDWLKGVTEHVGVAKDHSVKEVAESAGVWKRAVIRVYQQWENPSLQGILLGIVPGKASTKLGPAEQYLYVKVESQLLLVLVEVLLVLVELLLVLVEVLLVLVEVLLVLVELLLVLVEVLLAM